MPPSQSLGEFEQLVLLAILQLGEDAYAAGIRREIEERAERSVSRGALYATLDRLEQKAYLRWETEASTPARGGIPRRRFIVTATGIAALRASLEAIVRLSRGLEALPLG